MTRMRIVETDQGIQDELVVEVFDVMQRTMRDRGLIETNQIIASGITAGRALEIGPGPGYLGLEWLSKTKGTTLVGLDISPAMIDMATRNAHTYGLQERVEYVRGDGNKMSFQDAAFDAVFTNGSLHEWAFPIETLNEIWRVLKPGGRVFISDLRRDMAAPVRWMMWLGTKPRAIRPGLITSINAAYTPTELESLASQSCLAGCRVGKSPFGLDITGTK